MVNSGYILHGNVVDCSNQTLDIDNFKLNTVVPSNLTTCLFPFNTFKEPRAHQGDKYDKCINLKQSDLKGVAPNKITSYCPIAYEYTKKQKLSFLKPWPDDKLKLIQHFGVCSHTCPGMRAYRVKQSGKYGKHRKCNGPCIWQTPIKNINPLKNEGLYCEMGFDQKTGFKKWGHCICEDTGCFGRPGLKPRAEIPIDSQEGTLTNNGIVIMGIATVSYTHLRAHET